MRLPVIQGIIERRILLNYRIDPRVLGSVLPSNFKPKLVDGYAIGGICLIRLTQIRPKDFPAFLGVSSENSAHRIAVEWKDQSGKVKEGVFVPRRDTDSRLNAIAGGKCFGGVQHYSTFQVSDQNGEISMRIIAKDHETPLIELQVKEADSLPNSSVFKSLDESSQFFEAGCVGYSSRPGSCELDGISLVMPKWEVTPLDVQRVTSAFFDDRSVFPENSLEFDHALLMRNLVHEWHTEPALACVNKSGIGTRFDGN